MVEDNWTTEHLKSTLVTTSEKLGEKSTLNHLAAANGLDLMLYFLGESGANVNATDKNMNTPLHIAVKEKKESSARFLLSQDCNLEAKNSD